MSNTDSTQKSSCVSSKTRNSTGEVVSVETDSKMQFKTQESSTEVQMSPAKNRISTTTTRKSVAVKKVNNGAETSAKEKVIKRQSGKKEKATGKQVAPDEKIVHIKPVAVAKKGSETRTKGKLISKKEGEIIKADVKRASAKPKKAEEKKLTSNETSNHIPSPSRKSKKVVEQKKSSAGAQSPIKKKQTVPVRADKDRPQEKEKLVRQQQLQPKNELDNKSNHMSTINSFSLERMDSVGAEFMSQGKQQDHTTEHIEPRKSNWLQQHRGSKNNDKESPRKSLLTTIKKKIVPRKRAESPTSIRTGSSVGSEQRRMSENLEDSDRQLPIQVHKRTSTETTTNSESLSGDSESKSRKSSENITNQRVSNGPRPSTKPPPRPTVEASPKPAARPSAQPAARPSAKPSPRPSAKPSAAKPAPRPSAKPSPRPSSKPPAVKPAPRPSAKPSPKPAARPSATVTSGPSPKPTARPSATVPPKQSPKPSARPSAAAVTSKPSSQPPSKPATKLLAKASKPSPKPAARPSAKLPAKPSSQPSPKPAARPSAKLPAKPSSQPSPKPAARPSATLPAKTSPKPAARPSAKLSTQQSPKPPAKATAKQPSKPSPKPASKPAAKPAEKPTAKTVAKPPPKPLPKPATTKPTVKSASKAPASTPSREITVETKPQVVERPRRSMRLNGLLNKSSNLFQSSLMKSNLMLDTIAEKGSIMKGKRKSDPSVQSNTEDGRFGSSSDLWGSSDFSEGTPRKSWMRSRRKSTGSGFFPMFLSEDSFMSVLIDEDRLGSSCDEEMFVARENPIVERDSYQRCSAPPESPTMKRAKFRRFGASPQAA